MPMGFEGAWTVPDDTEVTLEDVWAAHLAEAQLREDRPADVESAERQAWNAELVVTMNGIRAFEAAYNDQILASSLAMAHNYQP